MIYPMVVKSKASARLKNRGLTPTLRGQTPNGPSGLVLQFDGVNDYVNCGNDPSLDITDAITIEAWVKIVGLRPSIIAPA